MSANPTSRLRAALLALGFACASLSFVPTAAIAAAAAAAAAHAPPPQNVLLRVQVGADGKVQGTPKSLDPNTLPVLVQSAQQVAGKLAFTPATKNGRAVASETTLVVTLGFEAKESGGYGISVLRALNGPSVVELGRAQPPKVPRSNGGLVVVGADLRADGTVDADTFQVEKAELRVPSEFDQAQYEKAARISLKDTRFMLDKVDGIETPSRISVAFMFNGGAAKRSVSNEAENREKDKEARETPPALTAVSRIDGVTLPKIDYTAPEKK
jgi:hypothetical protein